jgi:molybdate transport system substrate-binding protein
MTISCRNRPADAAEVVVLTRRNNDLIPIPGIDFVATLPEEVQKVTIFSAGIAAGSKQPDAARSLIACLGSVEAAPTIRKTGLDPIPEK